VAAHEPRAAPRLTGVIETALYVDDLARAARFYEDVLGLPALTSDKRFRAYDVGGRSVLLLFQRGATLATVRLPGGTIPPHDGHGPLHVAFAVPAEDLAAWTRRLEERGIAIEGRTIWPRGGESLYLRDPDGHLLEFATPGLWAIY
jgi:catechol-2,3-dioxygenase